MSSVSSDLITNKPTKTNRGWNVQDGLLAIGGVIVLPTLLALVAIGLAKIGILPKSIGRIFIDETPLAVLVQYVTGLVIESAIVIYLIRLRKIKFSDIGLTWPRLRWIAVALSLYILQLILAVVIISVIKALSPSLNLDQIQDIHPFGQSTWALIASFMSSVLIAPIIEEILFRGVLFGSLRTKLPTWLAAIIATAIFALLHGQANVMIYTFVFGLLLSWLYVRSRSLVPGMLLHLLNNSIAFWVLLHS